jgi:hypothetical protein
MPETEIRVYRDAGGNIPFKVWLDELKETEPRAYAKCLERILNLAQMGNQLRRPLADVLRDGIYELRSKVGKVNYRILYFFCGKNMACLSHGLTKEGAVPEGEIDSAVRRKNWVNKNLDKFTVEWEVE